MQITPVLHPDHIEVIFTNTSTTDELHLWEFWNSWGWWTVSFQLKSEQDSDIFAILHEDREWSVNGPTIFVLAPKEKLGFPFDLNDAEWVRDQAISHLKAKTISIRVCYHADPLDAHTLNFLQNGDESDKQWLLELAKVFTGSVVSGWVTSKPPHDWLFVEPPDPKSQS